VEPLIPINKLEAYLKDGKFAEGFNEYQALTSPSPRDDQLGGRCLWGLGRFEEAKIPFYKATQRGEAGAAVDLIGVHIQLNEFDEAKEWFEVSQTLELPQQDRVRALLYQGEIQIHQHQLRLSVRYLKKAWVQANLIPNNPNLVAQAANALAWSLHVMGNDEETLKYLNEALPKSTGLWSQMILHTRALSLIYNGKLEQAKNDLQQLSKFEHSNPVLDSSYALTNGMYTLASGDLEQARAELNNAQFIANKTDHKELITSSTCFYAATCIALGDLTQARAALMTLTNLELSPSEEASRQLRFGVLHQSANQLEQARIQLEGAVSAFSTLEHQRELAWSLLRLAHLHLELGNERLACQTLERVSDIANAVKSTAFLRPELNLMGEGIAQRLAAIASPYAMHALAPMLEVGKAVSIPLEARPAVRRLRIVTLGKPQLLADDRNVTPRLNKAMELIAYLSLHPQTSLERILDSVFPDSDPKAAANYFHQLRHHITKDVPELRVVRDRQTKTYALETGTIALESDYEEVIGLLNHATQNELHQALELYRGAFMPHLESEWVEEVRSNVEWLLVRSGLRVVQDLYERGNYEDCRKLTEKLRKVAPLDEGLNEMLVRATNEIDGLLAARRTLTDVEKYFHTEVGELPPALENLKREIRSNLN
jgi:tetratricopeptide (TPR) repeat protein